MTVEYEAATVSDLDQNARWFKTVGEHVVAVRHVKIARSDADFPTSHPWYETGYEVDFACGAKGWVRAGRDYSELDALVLGTKGYLHGLAVFRKHGNIVGSPCPWFMTQMGSKRRLNPNTAPRCCAAALYARAAGKPWGESLVLSVRG